MRFSAEPEVFLVAETVTLHQITTKCAGKEADCYILNSTALLSFLRNNCHLNFKTSPVMEINFNPFQPSVALHIEPNHLIFYPNQMIGFM